MNTIWLVIRREFVTRIRKVGFWVLTLLVPFLLTLLYTIPINIANNSAKRAHVLVVDETGIFTGEFRSSNAIAFHDAGGLDYARQRLASEDTLDAIVFIPQRQTTIPSDAFLYYLSDVPSMTVQTTVYNQMQEILHNRILHDVYDITTEEYGMISGTRIHMRTQDIESGRGAFLEIKIAVGIIMALLIVFAIALCGSQVVRGVMEEKSNRIVEIVICSIKPFQLMAGKILGVGLVGIVQFVLWLVLTGGALVGLQKENSTLFRSAEQQTVITHIATKGEAATAQMESIQNAQPVSQLIQGLVSIDYSVIVAVFLFFFVFGYLLYASVYAAAGSLADSDSDSQQFVIPVIVPLLFALLCLPVLISEPSGTLSTWLSIIPFTSPVAMIFRIPFGVPIWQIILSASLLVASLPLCTWVTSKIYHAAILQHGMRISLKKIFRQLKS